MDNYTNDRLNRQRMNEDVEFSQVATPDVDFIGEDTGSEDDQVGRHLSIIGIVLSVLAFFFVGYVFAPIGIVLGVLGVRQGNNLGWWAIGLGVVAFVVYVTFGIVTLPFRLFF